MVSYGSFKRAMLCFVARPTRRVRELRNEDLEFDGMLCRRRKFGGQPAARAARERGRAVGADAQGGLDGSASTTSSPMSRRSRSYEPTSRARKSRTWGPAAATDDDTGLPNGWPDQRHDDPGSTTGWSCNRAAANAGLSRLSP